MPLVSLLGDSIFDNRAYTGGEPDVVSHLRELLPDGWGASLLAVDGSTIADVPAQLARLPDGTTHLVVAVGGNDALLNSDVLGSRAATVMEALQALGDRVAPFERAYRSLVDRVLALGRATAICTIYNGHLEGEWGRAARLALTLFNDAILRVAAERRITVIELRLVCDRPEDYANPIEPSGAGGWKIARAVFRALTQTAEAGQSRIVGGE